MNHHDHHPKVVTIISTQTIKPSSPTPRHLTTFKLSLMDNHLYPFYMPFVFFYSAPVSSKRSRRFDILKSSLARALTRFYPLAGRLSRRAEDRTGSIPVVDCNDEGVPFSSASFEDCSMAQFLRRPAADIESLHRFLPFPAILVSTGRLESAPQIAVRATAFPCGGLAVGVCVLHKIIDGRTFGDFMKLWSAFCRMGGGGDGSGGAYAHNRAATSLFQARGDDFEPPALDFGAGEGENVTKRFVFDGEAVLQLKAKARSDRVPNPTRIEAVSGFLWNLAVNATTRALSPDGVTPGSVLSIAGMMLDLRPRMKEPWPDYSVGNIFWVALSFYDNNNQQQSNLSDEDKTFPQLVSKLRSSTAKIDKEFVGKLQGGNGRQELLKNQEMMWEPLSRDAVKRGDTTVMPFRISSAIGMGLYDVDFGNWGKPVWISMTKFPTVMTNMVVLMEPSNGSYGVEAWISLNKQEMTILEHEPEFRTYVKNNPPVLESRLARL